MNGHEPRFLQSCLSLQSCRFTRYDAPFRYRLLVPNLATGTLSAKSRNRGLQLARHGPHLPGEESSVSGGTHRMQFHFEPRLRSWSLIALLVCACRPSTKSESIPVHHVEGTLHGFLELRTAGGSIVASGDIVQVVHGDQVTDQTRFRFKDGSIDDETSVFSQRHTFQLITYHHVQKGSSFPHPMEVTIDVQSGQVTVRYTGKDGKEKVKTEHLNLPPDLANGMVPLVVENAGSDAAQTTVSMLVATPKPHIVKLVFSKRGEENFSLSGFARKANHFEIKVELEGIAGLVAPLIGKQPPHIQIWTVGGQAPTFIREQGPLYPEGPVMTIQLASPVWPEPSNSGD